MPPDADAHGLQPPGCRDSGLQAGVRELLLSQRPGASAGLVFMAPGVLFVLRSSQG